jgi:predicted nucleic acid-binding protein
VTVPLVIDASAMLAILRIEPEHDAVSRVLRAARQAGSDLLVPTGFWLEVVNSLLRRHLWTSERVLEGLHVLDRFGIRDVIVDRPMVLLSLDLAERHGLTSYDAAYLAVAIIERSNLLTLDDDLAAAAGDRAVPLDGLPRVREASVVYEREVTWPNYREASAYLARLRAEAVAGRG